MPETLLGGIAINEVLVDPNGANNFDTDGSGNARGGDEYVELVNTSDSAIDISGLELWDRARDNWFTFPSGTILEPGAVAVIVRNVQNGGSLPATSGNDLAFDADVSSGVFNNSGDNIVVYDPTNDEYIQAIYNGDSIDDPVGGPGYDGFSATATRSGAVEDFGNDQDGFSIQRGTNGFTNDANPTPGAENVCFVSGTLIETASGFHPVETLRPGDRVQTSDGGCCRIRWIFARRVTPADVRTFPGLSPIAVPAGIDGMPPLLVSRQHRLLISGKIAARMFGTSEVLVAAKDLLDSAYAETRAVPGDFAYYHVLLDDHHILNANGLAAESLYLGQETIKAMTAPARQELAMIFPELRRLGRANLPRASRVLAPGARARQLVYRHEKNQRPAITRFAQT